MDIVVDTSVIIVAIANEPEKEALVELTTGADLIAPQSVHWEIGNAFSAMLRRDRIKVGHTRGSQMIVYTYSEARQKLATLLEQAMKAGEVKIKRKDGQTFIIRPETRIGSPLDVEGIKLDITTAEIVQFIQEGRRPVYELTAKAGPTTAAQETDRL